MSGQRVVPKKGRPTAARFRAELPTRCVQIFEGWVRVGADLAYVHFSTKREAIFRPGLASESGEPALFTARLEWTDRGKGARLAIIHRRSGALVCTSKFGSPWDLDIGTVNLDFLPYEEGTARAIRALQSGGAQ